MNKFLFQKKKIAAAVLLAATSGSVFAQQCQTLVWSDEFGGNQLDTTKWEAQIGDGCDIGLCGWGNNELQWYKSENATVANGVLSITAKKQRVRSKAYTSARLRTANMPNSGEWKNGRFEARIKLPLGQGLWPAFWMLPTDPAEGWPISGEIDIMEATGQASMTAFGTIHYGEPYPNNSFQGNDILWQPDLLSDDFHTYAVEWEPNEIRWYLDDILYSVKKPSDLADPNWWTFENYQYHFLLNVAVGGSIGGTPDDSIFPATMEVDYVRVYDMGQPSVDGPHIVEPGKSGTYTVIDEDPNSTYDWSVPAGASMSGTGDSITVDFGSATSGDVSVAVTNSCGTYHLNVPIFVEPVLPVETVLDNFDGTSNMTYTTFTGDFQVVNGELVYTRNSGSQYDVIAATTAAIPAADAFLSGGKAFTIDIDNTDPALVGKEILIQLENSGTATPSNYPTGRHSKYEAHIEHANGKQTLRFRLQERVDGLTKTGDVDTIVILIEPNTFDGSTYVMDNINILGNGN